MTSHKFRLCLKTRRGRIVAVSLRETKLHLAERDGYIGVLRQSLAVAGTATTVTPETRPTMANCYRTMILLLSALIALAGTPSIWAQPPEQPPELKLPPRREPSDPAVAAVLDSNPTTSADLVRAAKILADLGRPDKAKEYLRQVIGARLSQQQLTALIEKFGSSMFTGLAARKELWPEAKQLAGLVLQAANRSLQDPQRLAGLIRQLKDPSQRQAAMAGLQEAHAAAVGALLEVLADSNRAAEHAPVRVAMAQMGSLAAGPLLAILEGADPPLAVEAIRVLAMMDAKRAAIHLLRPHLAEDTEANVRAVAGAAFGRLAGRVPDKETAVRLLRERAEGYFDRGQPVRGIIDDRVEIFRWDAAAKRCVAESYSPEDAALVIAARLARDAYALAPNDPQVRRLYLMTMLEAAAYKNGLDKALPHGDGTAASEAARFGTAVIEDLLERSVAGGHVAAATAAARILGRIGTAEKLLRQGDRPTPLVRAVRHPDRRLRLAATDAVIRLQAAGPFPGASYVPQSLAFFAGCSGVRRALVAGPSTQASRQLAGKLAELGFDVDTAGTGRELLRLAASSPDYELVLIDAGIETPTADFLLQQLRHDGRTATLRVGLIARGGQLRRAQRIAERDPMAMAFSRPHTEDAIQWQVERLATLAPRTFVAQAQRLNQAAEALDRLAELSGSSGHPYELLRVEAAVLVALYAPQLSTKAAAVLANLNTVKSQPALVEMASRWTQPLTSRAAAVKAFRRNTQQYGILLTATEIGRQYDRYNASEDLDVNTQQVLGLILDCIEAPTEPVRFTEDAEESRQ